MRPGLKFNTGFTPTSISGCQLWLDAADLTSLTLSGSNLTAIRDKSGVTSPTITGGFLYASNSLNGYGVIYNNNGYIRANFPTPFTSSVHTTFLVMVATSLPSDGTRAMSFRAPAGLPIRPLDYAFGSFRYLVRNPNTTGQAVTAFTNSYFIWTCYNSTFNLGLRLNGATDLTTNISTNTTTITGYGFGWNDEGDTQINFPGRIAESLVFNIVLTTAQIERIEAYLAQKWALKNNLPGNHPGITTTIYPSRRQVIIAPVPYYTQFSPTSISGSVIWLDAADTTKYTLSGSNVTQIVDKSSNAYTFTGSVGTYPTQTTTLNGLPVISSATGQYLRITNFNQNFLTATCFFVIRPTQDLSTVSPTFPNYTVIRGSVGGMIETGVQYFQANYYPYLYQSGQGLLSGNELGFSPLNKNLLITGIVTGTGATNEFYTNGSLNIRGGENGTFNQLSSQILNCIGHPQYSHGYDFAEILLFGTVLTSAQRQQVESYLAQKWGSTTSLPASHLNTTQPAGTPSFTQTVFKQIKRTIGSVDLAAKYSAVFNSANNSFLSIPANSALTLGTNNHTIEFWMYQTSRNQYDSPFIYGNTSYFAANNYYMDAGESGIGVGLGNGSGNWAVNINGGAARSLNEWHHYALVRNGTTFTLYINGISVGSASSSTNITAQGDVFKIGNHSTYGITGYITNFRVVNGTAVYTSNFTPPTSPLTAIPNTQILLQGLTDRSPNAFTITNNGGVTLSTSVSPFA